MDAVCQIVEKMHSNYHQIQNEIAQLTQSMTNNSNKEQTAICGFK